MVSKEEIHSNFHQKQPLLSGITKQINIRLNLRANVGFRELPYVLKNCSLLCYIILLNFSQLLSLHFSFRLFLSHD